jgi:hypothetical protein
MLAKLFSRNDLMFSDLAVQGGPSTNQLVSAVTILLLIND